MDPFDFRSVQKAPRGASGGKGRCLKAPDLARELALGVLQLSLAPERRPISRESLQEVRPLLAAAYTKEQSTIPTYLGQGRSGDGLGLHRPRSGAYPVCRENACLALKRLEDLGHPPAKTARLLGVSEEALLAAVAALPPYDTVAAQKPAPVPPETSGSGAGAGATNTPLVPPAPPETHATVAPVVVADPVPGALTAEDHAAIDHVIDREGGE